MFLMLRRRRGLNRGLLTFSPYSRMLLLVMLQYCYRDFVIRQKQQIIFDESELHILRISLSAKNPTQNQLFVLPPHITPKTPNWTPSHNSPLLPILDKLSLPSKPSSGQKHFPHTPPTDPAFQDPSLTSPP